MIEYEMTIKFQARDADWAESAAKEVVDCANSELITLPGRAEEFELVGVYLEIKS